MSIFDSSRNAFRNAARNAVVAEEPPFLLHCICGAGGVWQFRWSEKSPEGRRVYRKRVIGTVEQYPSEDAARRAVVGLVAEINSGDRSMYSNSMTVSQLSDHFEQRELGRDNTWRSYATKKSYHTYLKRWIVPHWGEYGLFQIRTVVEVESWLRRLPLAKSS